MTPPLRFTPGGLDHPAVVDLLRHHITEANANSPPDMVHALDLSALRDPSIRFWSVWVDDRLVGMGALKQLGPEHGEIKSMRVVAGHGRQGIGRAILDYLLREARTTGLTRVSLETGGNDAFAPARAMYERAGFTPCGAFGGYVASEFTRCYSMAL